MSQSRSVITSGQFFTLLFVSRAALTAIYSTEMSGIDSMWSFILPLIFMLPAGLLLMLPALVLSAKENSPLRNGGSIAAKALSFCYGVYFLYSALYNLAAMLDFLKDDLPYGIAPKLILALFLIGCTYAGAKGIESGARTSLVVLVLILLSVVVLSVFLFPDYSAGGFASVRAVTAVSFLDGTVFLISRLGGCSCICILSENIKGRLFRSAALWLSASTGVIIFLVLLFTGTAGEYLSAKKFQVFRVIDGSGVLQKAEPLFIIVVVCSSFCGIALFIISSAAAFSKAFAGLKIPSASVASGVILLLSVLFLPDDALSFTIRNKALTAILTAVFLTVIPTIMLILLRSSRSSDTAGYKSGRRRHNYNGVRVTMLAFAVLFFVVNASGCDALQLNQRIIVQGIGIDISGSSCRLTLNTLNTAHPEQDNSTSLMYSSGESVEEAIVRLERDHGKKLLLDQCLFVMFNNEAAKSGERVFSYLTSSNDMPKTANLFICENSAENTMKTAFEEFGCTSEDISLLSDSKAIRQKVPHCSLIDLIAAEHSGDAVDLPVVSINRQNAALTITNVKS